MNFQAHFAEIGIDLPIRKASLRQSFMTYLTVLSTLWMKGEML